MINGLIVGIILVLFMFYMKERTKRKESDRAYSNLKYEHNRYISILMNNRLSNDEKINNMEWELDNLSF